MEHDKRGYRMPAPEVRQARARAGVDARLSLSRAVSRIIEEFESLSDADVARLGAATWPRVSAASYHEGCKMGMRLAAQHLTAAVDAGVIEP